MGRILCTFPGRAGDLFWALPTLRAISERVEAPVDLQIAGEFESLLPLLRAQGYLDHVCANPHWGLSAEHSWQAPDPVGTPAGTYDRVFHLGYRGWPHFPLPFEVQANLTQQWPEGWGDVPGIDLERPWIQAEPWTEIPHRIAIGWTDCWFELKVGLQRLIARNWRSDLPISGFVLAAPGSRWITEEGYLAVDWLEAAQRLAAADGFLGDCSALHVLAVAQGVPAVLVEPMEARWNPIFYPLGQDGPEVTLVKGLDGLPTFDARHTAEVLAEVLGG